LSEQSFPQRERSLENSLFGRLLVALMIFTSSPPPTHTHLCKAIYFVVSLQWNPRLNFISLSTGWARSKREVRRSWVRGREMGAVLEAGFHMPSAALCAMGR
jgi:hypothetical protein